MKAIALLFICALLGSADQLIVSNFPDGQNLGFGHGVGNGAGQGVSFTGGFTATRALIPLQGFLAKNAPLGTQVFIDLALNADAADGLPGSTLATFTEEGPIPTAAGAFLLFDCVACPALQAGTTYWLTAMDTNPLTSAVWFASFTDQSAYALFEFGAWSAVAAGHDTPAFRLFGNPTVPEPGSLALLATAIVGILAIIRKRRWRSV